MHFTCIMYIICNSALYIQNALAHIERIQKQNKKKHRFTRYSAVSATTINVCTQTVCKHNAAAAKFSSRQKSSLRRFRTLRCCGEAISRSRPSSRFSTSSALTVAGISRCCLSISSLTQCFHCKCQRGRAPENVAKKNERK